MADGKLQDLIFQGDLIAQTNTGTPPYSPYKLPTVLDGLFTTSLAATRAANSALQLAVVEQVGARGCVPEHATRFMAWRKVAGSTPEPSGMSDTGTVGAAERSPFVPGGSYELWVTGRNSAGAGTASNKVTWTAT